MISEEQKVQLRKIFKSIDDKRLLYGVDDREALFLHGMMLGMRETLESNGYEIEDITGLWWYEQLGEPKRQESIEELKQKYGTTGKMDSILKGSLEGIRWTLEAIGKPAEN